MSWRSPEWQQMGVDALRATLDVGEPLKQQMIDFLLEEGFWDRTKLSAAAARSRFNACLDPSKREFFKASEIWALMKRFRRYQFLLAQLEDMGFEQPRLVPERQRRADIERQRASLREQYEAELASLDEQLEQLEADAGGADARPRPPLRIHPATREPGPRFAFDDGTAEGGF